MHRLSRVWLVGLWLPLVAVGQQGEAWLLGQYDPATSPAFVVIERQYRMEVDRVQYLHHRTYAAFQQLSAAARREGVQLLILSGTRTFEQQRRLWAEKWTKRASIADPVDRARHLLRYSAMPGTSRHHWGTDIDLNSVYPAYYNTPYGRRMYQWLQRNAARFGFCQPYTQDPARPGYQPEPWHWSYRPLADSLLREHRRCITYQHLHGFDGSQTASALQVLRDYVGGVACPPADTSVATR